MAPKLGSSTSTRQLWISTVFVLDKVGDDVRAALEQWGAVHLDLAGGF